MKKYIVIGVIQLLIVMLFSLVIYLMFKVEKIILNPIPYTIGLEVSVIILNIVILRYLFKKYKDENEWNEITNN